MAARRAQPRAGVNGSRAPQGLPALAAETSEDLVSLGEALKARADEVLEKTVARTIDSGEVVDSIVQESFERICTSSTVAVASWIGGESLERAQETGREAWKIFGELAARRAASLNEVTRRCLCWRDVMAEALDDAARELDASTEARSQALRMLQISLEISLVRMCECFESERQRTDAELAQREEELVFLATHDPLTGLPNRTLILDRVEQMLARGARSQTPVAALFVDLDNFKGINDTLGHGAGDELLQAVAGRLDGVVRGADTLGRLGGDEFVVISEEAACDGGPQLVAERLLEALEPPFRLDAAKEVDLTITASVGIAMGEQSSAEELLRDADIAMYRAKWDGRNRYVIFENGMQDTIRHRMELEMDLRHALANGEFFLAYQPTFALSDMSPKGVEALVRWRHPTRGSASARRFHPAAGGVRADHRDRQMGAPGGL